ncbi:phosphotransferase [Isoptericola sp. BMS4]|uniref:phosphotransferase n=1 Tax=Isoptericola sp. BMS4 TaxID=2527875 RepID=UPI001422EA96|nr:phosphotransferase [Isoptericola sp. BMS4]
MAHDTGTSPTRDRPTRTRPTWPELPAEVRAGLEERIGGTVLGWTSHDGGYSPGMASTLRTTRGPLFVKAVSTEHEGATHLYREEARRSALLPEGVPAPALLWSAEIGPACPDGRGGDVPRWVAVAFEAVPGARAPHAPWRDDDLDAVQRLCAQVASFEVAPGELPELAEDLPADRTATLADELPAGLDAFDPWFAAHLDRLADIAEHARAAVAGPALVHHDLRGDNALLVDGTHGPRALAVDWPYASRGAAFCDQVGMLPATELEGGPPPEEVLRRRPLPAGTDDDAVTAFLAAITGYFVHASLQPPPPAIPHARAFQRAQGEVAVAWLRRRLRT